MITKTKAAILTHHNKPLKILNLDLPDPEVGEVLVKIYYSGICHTQLLEIAGKNASKSFIPNMMGHEASGKVIKVGAKVKKVKKGDFVILSWIKGKGLNVVPKPINYKNKKINRGSVTTFSEYSVVSENRVFPLKNKTPLDVSSLLGCAVPTGMGMIFNNARVKQNSTVLVLGCGGIGINAIHASKVAKAKTIIGIDINNVKKKSAIKFGATHFLNYKDKNLLHKIKSISNKVDYAIDTVGIKKTMEFVYNVCDNVSGHTILCGVPNPLNLKISINPFPLYYGKKITGTGGGETIPDKDLKKYENLYKNKKIDLKNMISKVYSLQDINKAIKHLKKGNCIRVLIDMRL